LLYAQFLDDYHEPVLQRYHLIRLLQIPPDGNGLAGTGPLGRFCCAGRFVGAAKEINLATFELSYLLNQRNGRTRGYWRIGTTSSEQNGGHDYWPEMLSEGRMAVGYPMIGDVSSLLNISKSSELKQALREELVRQKYPHDASAPPTQRAACTFDANVLYRLTRAVQLGDIVLACRGSTVLGVGKVTGDYRHVPGTEFAHARPVQWLDKQEWRLPGAKVFRGQILTDLARYPDILVEAERRLIGLEGRPTGVPLPLPDTPEHPLLPLLPPLTARLDAILRRKGQAILYGPPGTGKTYWAIFASRELAARKRFGKPFADLSDSEKSAIGPSEDDESVVRLASFHPGYGYEDFLEGYRPVTNDGQLSFELSDGLFKRLCKAAAAHPDQDYFLIIDEINRAEVPRVFGELLTSLELDKRAAPIHLPLSGERFRIPDNVYVVGTMNTADRSISMLDAALRRRFGFIELMPDYDALQYAMVGGLPLSAWLEELNRRLLEVLPRDARSLQVGHAYLLDRGRPVDTLPRLAAVLRDDILPLLIEYCYEDFGALERVLGDGLVDTAKQRVRDELFGPNREAELVEVLETMFPELGLRASAAAAEIEAAAAEATTDETGEDAVEPPDA
jgi:5-methylcytosine-specific restriction enzyme B